MLEQRARISKKASVRRTFARDQLQVVSRSKWGVSADYPVLSPGEANSTPDMVCSNRLENRHGRARIAIGSVRTAGNTTRQLGFLPDKWIRIFFRGWKEGFLSVESFHAEAQSVG
jgi:hypothetical protein